jgi:transcriptional regulator with XRE-family HTH domain
MPKKGVARRKFEKLRFLPCGWFPVNESQRRSIPDYVDRHIGKRLRQGRERLGETPQYVAHSLKLRVVEYLQLEAGNGRLGAERLARAAAVFRVDVGWFFEGLTTDEWPTRRTGRIGLPTKIVDLHLHRRRKRRG